MRDAVSNVEGADNDGPDEIQYDIHQSRRDHAARLGYIRWRMNDLPTVYVDLMPYTSNARELWEAEKAIRRQVKEDQELLASPWARIGPRCNFLDFSGFSGEEHLAFGWECEPGLCMPDAVKAGFENHPEVLAAWEHAKAQPVYQLHVKQSELIHRIRFNSEEKLSSAEVDAIKAQIAEINAEIKKLGTPSATAIFKMRSTTVPDNGSRDDDDDQ